MDISRYLHQTIQAQRNEEMKTSEQLTLGELIAKLEAIEDKSKPVIYNEQYHPTQIDSWRGRYAELALDYEEDDEKRLTVQVWLMTLKSTIGLTLEGYKGGEFLMGKTTPVWVANYGESYGFEDDNQAVTDVSENEQYVIIETKNIDY